MSEEDGRVRAVWMCILMLGSCFIFTFIAILFGILCSAYYDPTEMLNSLSCTVLEPKHECVSCESTHTCCSALVSVKPGTLFASATNFQVNRTTLEFSDESTYYSYAFNTTTSCYVNDDPTSTQASFAKYNGIKVEFKTAAIITGCISILCTCGILITPFFSRAMKAGH